MKNGKKVIKMMNFKLLNELENVSGSILKSKLLEEFIINNNFGEKYIRLLFSNVIYNINTIKSCPS